MSHTSFFFSSFGLAFRQAAEFTKSKILHDGFDSWTVYVEAIDFTKFMQLLQVRFNATLPPPSKPSRPLPSPSKEALAKKLPTDSAASVSRAASSKIASRAGPADRAVREPSDSQNLDEYDSEDSFIDDEQEEDEQLEAEDFDSEEATDVESDASKDASDGGQFTRHTNPFIDDVADEDSDDDYDVEVGDDED